MSHFGTRLLEVDFSGIEAVQVGWYIRDPNYIRLAKLGMHAYLASYLLGRPGDLTWPDDQLLAYLKMIKKTEEQVYDKSKRIVHGTNFGMTPYGTFMQFPTLYPTLKDAERVQTMYFEIAPELPAWHAALRDVAYAQGYLGGTSQPEGQKYPFIHPYHYRHWFWSVVAYKPISEKQVKRLEADRIPIVQMHGRSFAASWGLDSKRVIAYYPQSTAAGNIKEAMLELFGDPDADTYIGDAYYGRTPLRAPIHDSLLLEVPDRKWDRVVEAVYRAMLRPIEEQPLPLEWNMGRYLTIGVEGKAGRNWANMETLKTPSLPDLGLDPWAESTLAGETTYYPAEEEEEEGVMDLATVVEESA